MNLNDSPDNSLCVSANTLLLVLLFDLDNALLSLVWCQMFSADELDLSFSHSSINIDLADWCPERSVRRDLEPGVDLPDQVEEDKERTCQVSREESLSREIWSSDWIQRGVELRSQADEVDESTDVRASHTEGGLEW